MKTLKPKRHLAEGNPPSTARDRLGKFPGPPARRTVTSTPATAVMDRCPAWGTVAVNLTPPREGSVSRTGRNPVPRPSFKWEKQKAEANDCVNLPNASFFFKVVFGRVHAIARRGFLGLVPGGPPGACSGRRALYGFYFSTLSCQGMRGCHTEAPNPRLQPQRSGKLRCPKTRCFPLNSHMRI